jgi:CheY-like chemotaxis protein
LLETHAAPIPAVLLCSVVPGLASGDDTRITMAEDCARPRILIVDDIRLIRDLIKSFYDEYDFELIEAVNGLEAVSMARACSPVLILLDIQMPKLNGYEVAAILKNDKTVKDIPILVITGIELAEVEERISGMCDGYLRKPFRKDDLIKETMKLLPGMQQGFF